MNMKFIKQSQFQGPDAGIKNTTESSNVLSDDVKGGLAGMAAGLTSTMAMYPVDTISASKQVGQKAKYDNVSLKDLADPPKQRSANPFSSKKRSRKNVAKDLGKKFYGGIGSKLMKAVPAAGISFATYGATRRGLDKLDDSLSDNIEKTSSEKANKVFEKYSQAYTLEKEERPKTERLAAGFIGAGLPSAGLTSALNLHQPAMKNIRGAAEIGALATGAGYFLSPSQKTVAKEIK